jgi:hypothetical protein
VNGKFYIEKSSHIIPHGHIYNRAVDYLFCESLLGNSNVCSFTFAGNLPRSLILPEFLKIRPISGWGRLLVNVDLRKVDTLLGHVSHRLWCGQGRVLPELARGILVFYGAVFTRSALKLQPIHAVPICFTFSFSREFVRACPDLSDSLGLNIL